MTGHANVVIATGVDSFSDLPIRPSHVIRKKLIAWNREKKKYGTISRIQRMISGLRRQDIALEIPAVSNYTTGELMGESSDKMSATFGISRTDQDQYAFRSHTLAAQAHDEGFYQTEVIPYRGSMVENGIQRNPDLAMMTSLQPSFIKPHGTHTPGNSCFLSDGTGACLIMNEEKALQLGYQPWAYLRDWSFRACDPFTQMLLGPTYCSYEIIRRNKLDMMRDIDVYEIHEAFAGQVLSNVVAMNSHQFALQYLPDQTKVGEIDIDRLNTKGGSISIGNPFGATGVRLVTTAARRLQQEQKQFALVAICCDGGIGHACLLERYDH
jgi:acetyl-CoA acyltransferase